MNEFDQFVRPMDLHRYAPGCDGEAQGVPCVRVVPGPAYDALAARLAEAERLLTRVANDFGAVTGMSSGLRSDIRRAGFPIMERASDSTSPEKGK